MLSVIAFMALLAWIWLLMLRGDFWQADQHLQTPGWMDGAAANKNSWPSVIAVIPARNEARTIGVTVASLLEQDYPGAFGIVLIDDNSEDDTANKARKAAGDSVRLSVLNGTALEPGWTGKLWALQQGINHARELSPELVYLLFTDADIKHDRDSLRRLVAKAEIENLDMVSLMVMLRCKSFWEHLLIPAFVFFFQKLYPFSWVNDPRMDTAAAAGGCMLVRRSALERSGGVSAIRGSLIDDCAMATLLKRYGSIWLGLSDNIRSLRSYNRLYDVWKMVARTAFVQLKYSGSLLIATVAAMILLYLAPPIAAILGIISGDSLLLIIGIGAWFLMALAYEPVLYLYGLSAWRGLFLPLVAMLYVMMTVYSAICHWRGKGGEWKGRRYV